jgi:predicted tellurium resistance membrane protein TerC
MLESDNGPSEPDYVGTAARSVVGVVAQIMLIDMIFSLDSILTAIGLLNHIPMMVAAIVITVIIMLVAAEPLSAYIDRHPTTKMLALSMLIMIGMVLVADGFGMQIEKAYIYFAVGFSLGVEILNQIAHGKKQKKSPKGG